MATPQKEEETMNEQSIQDRFAPKATCFGCGPANEKGLRIKSFPDSDTADAVVRAKFTPEPHHQAFPNVLNGGIVGALLDCHSNWTAAWHLYKRDDMDDAPCTVTAEFHVKLKRPTPMETVQLEARATESDGNWVTVEATLSAGGKVTATCTGRFVAVGPDHPGYHRW